ncbi:MAG: M15 family metallopeptidase [Paludibacter sp.]
MKRFSTFIAFLSLFILQSCVPDKKEDKHIKATVKFKSAIIVDSHYTFNEAIAGINVPKEILNQLQLINVRYYSLDGKIHQGQILTNKMIAQDLIQLFEFILYNHFPIAHAIPIVKYHQNDDLSMQANNTYSFCYRNTSYSKHATGMAIDINPFFNPVRWKAGYENRIDKPIGAVNNPKIAGTFYVLHPVVLKFKEFGFRWGHNFTRNFDDHHFEK